MFLSFGFLSAELFYTKRHEVPRCSLMIQPINHAIDQRNASVRAISNRYTIVSYRVNFPRRVSIAIARFSNGLLVASSQKLTYCYACANFQVSRSP